MPISDCEVRDPRIRRTRQMLQAALQSLLEKKSFDEISVQNIAETATIKRATFYDHYTDKFALFEALVAGGFHRLLHERKVRYEAGCEEALETIILTTCDYLAQRRGGSAECQKQSPFEPLADAAIIAAIQGVIFMGVAAKPNKHKLSKLTATAASWAIFGAAKEWLGSPDRVPAAKVVSQVLRIIGPMLDDKT